jgi:hypothetical protein
MFNKSNFKEWFDRYKYSEIAATSAALLMSQLSQNCSGLATAYFVVIAEYFAFYGVILYIEYTKHKEKNKKISKKTSFKEVLFILRNLVLEFGYPAILDFVFVRPFFMYWMPIVCGNFMIGILLGKLIADFLFYLPTIINYELIKKKL